MCILSMYYAVCESNRDTVGRPCQLPNFDTVRRIFTSEERTHDGGAVDLVDD